MYQVYYVGEGGFIIPVRSFDCEDRAHYWADTMNTVMHTTFKVRFV